MFQEVKNVFVRCFLIFRGVVVEVVGGLEFWVQLFKLLKTIAGQVRETPIFQHRFVSKSNFALILALIDPRVVYFKYVEFLSLFSFSC